ncbi:MAG: hypothetical protein JXJ04_01165 [Spirochaetales bacterium]|nr:hypothetical protein [Spirochaetales bacterium]
MKKLNLLVVLVLFIHLSSHGNVIFSGSLKTNLSLFLAFPYDDDRFDTLINPNNFLGMHDIQGAHYLLTKIEGEDEKSFFSLWLGFNTYRIAEALYAAAFGDDSQTYALSETLPFLGTEIGNVELLRATVSFYATDTIVFNLGRQQMHTGYGYGWNPIDFANPLKDPYEPDAELKGVDAVKMTLALGNIASLSLSGIYNGSDSPNGINFENIMVLSENTLYFPGVEIMVNGLYEYDEKQGEDTTPMAVGIGSKFDLFDIGFYGEGAARFGSRNYYYDSTLTRHIKTETLFSALAGLEYVFPNELMLILEYFYNGEGFSAKEKDNFKQSVESAIEMFGYPGSEQIMMIIPGYINNHYILCHLMYPLYDQNMELQLLMLFSPDAMMLNILPGVSFNISGSFTLTAGYTGLFDFDNKKINEASVSPFKHMLNIEGAYFF